MKKTVNSELLAPAGSFLSVRAAVHAGADAVYMGGQRFGARAYAESANTTEEDMVMEAIRYCHLFSVKLYMTVNILFKAPELEELFSYLKPYYEAGLDGVIVQDTGCAMKIRELFPGLPVHASTQMTITGKGGIRFAERLGMTRAVLARELSLKEIADIHRETGMELEAFCHGAMCYSYSGACFMSSFLGGRSGNRGRCAGTCRLCYTAMGEKGYFLSMKDMETIDLLPEMLKAGVYSFKVEGRMKSPVYTAGVISVYRKYLDMAEQFNQGLLKEYRVLPEDRRILREVFDRGGVDTYLRKHNGQEMIAVREKPFRAPDPAIIQDIEERFIRQEKTIEVDAEAELRIGSPAVLRFKYGETEVTAESEQCIEKAENRAMTEEEIAARLKKTGNTVIRIRSLRIWMDEQIFLPVAALNSLRRTAAEALTEEILRGSRRSC